MPLCGTFRYFAIVPAKLPDRRSSPWPVQLAETVDKTSDEMRNARLIGLSPCLEITDAGPTPNPTVGRPAVFRSRLTLTASARDNSTVSSASFYVDKDLTSTFEPRDRLHMARTPCGGLGLSLLRQGRLVFAVGVVSSVPLGSDVQAATPYDLVREAETVFKKGDPDFEFRELPLRISIDGRIRLGYGGRQEVGHYNIWVEHGFLRGIPGTDECAAIALKGACGSVPAIVTAQLLNGCQLEMVEW